MGRRHITDEEADTGKRHAWCFTYCNPTVSKEKLCEILMCWKVKYLVIGFEHAPTTGTPHFQGFVNYAAAKTFVELKNKFDAKISFRKARAVDEDQQMYCSKEDPMPLIVGVPSSQGKRSDLNEIKEILRNGGGMRDIMQLEPSYQGIRMAELYLKYDIRTRSEDITVEWYWGVSGGGKTRGAKDKFREMGKRFWMSNKDLQWWDGYDGQECVLLDELRPGDAGVAFVLKILDPESDELKVPVKGGFRNLLASHIIVTSALSPDEFFKGYRDEDVYQLLRRISNVKHFSIKFKNLIDAQKSAGNSTSCRPPPPTEDEWNEAEDW